MSDMGNTDSIKMLSFSEVGSLLSVSKRTVERLVKDGQITCVGVFRQRRITVEALRNFIDRNTTSANVAELNVAVESFTYGDVLKAIWPQDFMSTKIRGDTRQLCCPECGLENVHIEGTKTEKVPSWSGSQIVSTFFCECGHRFALLFCFSHGGIRVWYEMLSEFDPDDGYPDELWRE